MCRKEVCRERSAILLSDASPRRGHRVYRPCLSLRVPAAPPGSPHKPQGRPTLLLRWSTGRTVSRTLMFGSSPATFLSSLLKRSPFLPGTAAWWLPPQSLVAFLWHVEHKLKSLNQGHCLREWLAPLSPPSALVLR